MTQTLKTFQMSGHYHYCSARYATAVKIHHGYQSQEKGNIYLELTCTHGQKSQ